MPSHDPPCRYSPWCDSFESTARNGVFSLGQQLGTRLVSSVHFAFEVSAGGLAAATPTTRARANTEEAGRGRGPPDAPHRGHNHPGLARSRPFPQLCVIGWLCYVASGGGRTPKRHPRAHWHPGAWARRLNRAAEATAAQNTAQQPQCTWKITTCE